MIFIIFAIGIFNTIYPMSLVEEYIEHYTGVQKKDISRPLAIAQPIAKSANQEFSLFSSKLSDKEDMYAYQLFHKSSNLPVDCWHDSSEWKHALINNSGTHIITKRTRFQYNNTHDVKTGDNSDFWLRTIIYKDQKKKTALSSTTVLQRPFDLKYFFDENVVIALEDIGSRLVMVAWDITNNFSNQNILPSIALNYPFFNPLQSCGKFDQDKMLIADTDCKEKAERIMISLWNIKTNRTVPYFFEFPQLVPPFILAISSTKRYYAVSSGKNLMIKDIHNNDLETYSFEDNINHINFDALDLICCLTNGGKYKAKVNQTPKRANNASKSASKSTVPSTRPSSIH